MQLTFSFSSWHIEASEGILGRQYDNLAHQIVVVGSLPAGYTWDMLVECRGNYNVIPLTVNATGASATLTADQLALTGYYDFQLRGTQDGVIHHTNTTQVFIPDTIVGPGTWPVLPTEFSEAEAAIKELNAHPPVPGGNGYWMLWDLDTHSYVQSQLVVPGLHIEIGETTTGEPGTPANVTNSGTNTAPVLNFTIPEGEKGDAATIQVGTVAASDPGSEPQVKNSGTENAAVFDFVLPRGNTGPTGPAATIEVESTVTGEPGTQASVENVGTTGAAKLRFTIPRGDTGQNGVTPTLSAGDVETLEPDQPATASVTGDGPAYQINLGIPRGQTGAQGTPGQNGQDGQTPTISVGTVTTLDPGQDATAEITGETPNLTLNLGIPEGQPGQDGVQLNDSAINTTEAWSSKKIVDTLCPAFSVSGNPVTCNPVEGYPLSAVVSLEPKQAGSGDPSPENVRPISGYDSVTVTQSKDEAQVKQITLTLPETIYGGTVDAVTGVGSKEWAIVTLSSEFLTTNLWQYGSKAMQTAPVIYGEIPMANGMVGDIYCTHFRRSGKSLPIENLEYWSGNQYFGDRRIAIRNDEWTSLDDAKTWLDAQAAAGTPVQVAYKLATPEPFQATGNQALPAVAGLNTLYTDADSLAVSGRSDPLPTIQTMQAQITALQDQATQGGTA